MKHIPEHAMPTKNIAMLVTVKTAPAIPPPTTIFGTLICERSGSGCTAQTTRD
jgi:hypothetical protein